MAHQMKMATCCYCGRKTALKLTARNGHELACGACGAPLHELKALKTETASRPKAEPRGVPHGGSKRRKSKKSKKRKPLWKKAMGEVADLIEDIFD